MISPGEATKEQNEGNGLVFHQDPVEELLKIFDAAFRVVVPGPGRQIVGLKSISEKQNGAPGWYLWFEDHPGAYLLELAEAGTRAQNAGGTDRHREAVQGRYRIKYYPEMTDLPSLSLFSVSEQAFRKSGCFDETGTPDFERGDEIPDAFFQIGSIEAGMAADAGGFVLRLEAPDRWITWTVEAIAATDEQGCAHGLRAAGEKDRDVPAWQWSWFLLDRLVLILCLAYASAPRQAALYDAAGQGFRIYPGGLSRALPDEAIRHRWLSLSFRLGDGQAPHAGSLLSLSDDPAFLLTAPSGKCLVSLRREPSEPVDWVSSAWWHVRENRLDQGSVLPC